MADVFLAMAICFFIRTLFEPTYSGFVINMACYADPETDT